MFFDRNDSSRFGRVNLDNHPVKPEFKAKWQGQIVSYDGGTWWSLGGRPYEGVGIGGTPLSEYIKPIKDDELELALLLEDTFWKRDKYTENIDYLKSL